MYEFNWEGKELAYKLAQTPSTGTLIPDKESSKNWDTTENLYIEGDNLEVLKLLQKSYFGKVKMIYIDPPYNTGNDFVYHDNFKDNIANYKEITNQSTKANPETNGRYHTDWLNMMYPRLKLARNLLKEDGIIFISIDDNEVENLQKIADEIFGENNFITFIVWQCLDTVKNDAKYFSNNHEYILCYGKDIEKINIQGIKKGEKQRAYYKNYDNDPRGDYLLTPLHAKSGNKNSIYTYTFSNGQIWSPPKGTYPRFSKETLRKLDEENRIYLDRDGKRVPQKKTYLKDVGERMPPVTFWEYSKFGSTRQSNLELSSIMGKGIFQNPKPIKTISTLIDLIKLDTEEIILDFFSGSSTTANAILKLNSEDDIKRKFIMVQLPELTDEKSEAYKAGYKNICEIGKERIRRAGDKIVSENKDKEGIENLDIGFKVFKLSYDNSNNKGDDKMYNEKLIELSNKTNIMYKEHQVYELKDMYFYILNAYEEYIEWRYKNDVFWHIEHSEEFYNRLMNPMKIEILTNKKPKELKGKKKIATINKDADYKVQVFIDDDYNLYYQDNHAFASCESKIVDNKVETIWNSCKCWFKITGLYECRNNHMVDILRDLNSYSEYLYPKNNVADNVMLSRLYEQMVNVYLDYVND